MSEVYLNYPIIGGLGNQLFIIAAAFRMQDETSARLVLLRRITQGTRPEYWNSFFIDCPRVLETLCDNLPQIQWKTQPYMRYSSQYEDRLDMIKGISTINQGYFQNVKYLPSQSYLRELFNITEKQDRMRRVMSDLDPDTTCAIHFRLGDYKWLTNIFLVLPDSYYKNALSIVLRNKPRVKTLLIFNEIEDQHSVQERMKFILSESKYEVKFMSQYYMQDWQEMIIMSLCTGIIIANSTFSWWSAYFASNTTIVYPSYWHHEQGDTIENALALPTWNKVEI